MNRNTFYIGLVILAIIAVYFLFIKKSRYYIFFQKELGFGDILLDQFTEEELRDSYYFIKRYTRNNVELTPEKDARLYASIVSINRKFQVFTGVPYLPK